MLIGAAHYGCAGGNLASSVELRVSRYLISALERFRYLDPLENIMKIVTILMRTIIITIIQECTKRFAFNFSDFCIGEQHSQAEPKAPNCKRSTLGAACRKNHLRRHKPTCGD